jgi:hypothetical protein
MLLSQPRVYTEDADDQQYQNPAPIPRQEPIPGGVWGLELSFADGGVRREKTLNRLCYRRMDSQWRLRDEKAEWNAQGALVVVSGMVGDMVCLKSRNDQVAHVFHDGFVVVKDGLAHLYENGSYPNVVA